jgi:hypothetical protein
LRKGLSCVLLGFALLAGIGLSVRAQESETSYPRFEAEIDIEVQDDWTFDSDDPDAELNDLFTTTEPALALYLIPGLSIQSGLVLEPVRDPDPGEDRYFEDHGFFAEQLYLLYERNGFSLHGGKFNLPFGVGWDLAPGVYGTDVAEAFYEQVERIGVGGSVTFGGGGIGGSGFGEHRLSAQTFFLDTTFLSESAGANRGRTRKDDGGVSNTEDFSSFALSLDGGGFSGPPFDVNYHVGLAYQEGGEGDPKDEFGFAAALYGAVELSEDVTLEPIVEFVHFDNAEGIDQTRNISTAGASLVHGPWNAALSYSGVRSDPDDPQDDLDVDQFQVSMGHSFDFGLDIDVGYKFVDEEGTNGHVVGVIFHYVIDFAIPD